MTYQVFDTTLRDGAQREGITYSVADKLAVARLLDELGVGFIEGGWPGAMPKDTEFFERAKTELKGLMPEDAKEAYGHRVRAKRSKSGAVSFEMIEAEAGHASVE